MRFLELRCQQIDYCTYCLVGELFSLQGKITVSVLLEKCQLIDDATPDLLLLIQQKLCIVQYRYGSR